MINQKEYQQRRLKVAQSLPENTLAIISSGEEILRNGDSHYRFRTNSYFYYLTGFKEPDSILVILSGVEAKSILFCRPHNPAEEQWTGKRLGQQGALDELQMDEAYNIAQLETELTGLLQNKSAVYYLFGQDDVLEHHIKHAVNLLKLQIRRGVTAPVHFSDLTPILSEMRLIKSDNELEVMRQAAKISIAAHERVMRQSRCSVQEYELEAEFLYELHRHGCSEVAYSPIVANGENACILHYIDNDKKLKPQELLLIDAGGEYQNYAADITRTFPVCGKFSEDQKLIYNLVLKAQQAGIALIKPGAYWNTIQQTIVEILTQGLIELDILKGPLEKLIKEEAYRPFYMHNSGHWLGLDVHDCGAYKIDGEWRPLQKGMVLTVEPGLYFNSGNPNLDKRWWGIGVRIEDDIAVTEDGHENLTAALAVTVSEIEALMCD